MCQSRVPGHVKENDGRNDVTTFTTVEVKLTIKNIVKLGRTRRCRIVYYVRKNNCYCLIGRSRLDWLTVARRRDYFALCLLYKYYLDTSLPRYFDKLFIEKVYRCPLRSFFNLIVQTGYFHAPLRNGCLKYAHTHILIHFHHFHLIHSLHHL